MKDALENARKFYDNLSKRELIDLLNMAGFEVEDGHGEILYTDAIETSFHFTVTASISAYVKTTQEINPKDCETIAFKLAS